MRRPTPIHRNLFTHLTAAVVVPGCIALCWWQVTRALSGNTLSWAYVFEWPIFAGYGVYMWWKLIHDHPRGTRGEDDGPAHRTVSGGGLREVVGPGDSPVDGDTDTHAHQVVVPVDGDDDDVTDTEADEDLASYNRYLAALNASGKRKHW